MSHGGAREHDVRAFPHAEPRPYHEMLRTWDYAWWRPVVGISVTVLGFLLVGVFVLYVVAAIAAAFGGPGFVQLVDIGTHVYPATLLGINLGIAAMTLVVWFVLRVVHRLRPRWLTSVVPGMRWRLFAVCLGLALVALVAQVLVGQLLPGHGDGNDIGGSPHALTSTLLADALIVLLTTPLQAAAEEFVFRGYLLMAFGSLFRSRWVAIGATATLFALAHGAQNAPLFVDRLAFGLIAGWLVTRTGGLEAGIALHVLNNFLAFGIALVYGDLTSTLNVSTTSWWNIVLTLTQSVVYVAVVLLATRRMGLQTRTRPPWGDRDTRLGQASASA